MKHLFLYIMLLLPLKATYAQETDVPLSDGNSQPHPTIGDLLKQMPDSLMPLLTKNNRLDMLDFLDAKMKAEVNNRLGGTSEMTYVSSDSLSIRMNDVERADLFLIDVSEKYDSCHRVIVFRRNLIIPSSKLEESSLVFYSCKWNRLHDSSLLSCPAFTSNIRKEDDRVFSKAPIER